MDSLMGLYRIHIHSKKYYHRIFFHLVDMAIVNAWLLYRRAQAQVGLGQTTKLLPLSDFKAEVAEGLCKVRKLKGRKRSAGRPEACPLRAKVQRVRGQPIPVADVRFDEVGHWPQVIKDRMHCRVEACRGQSRTKCLKCGVHLCLSAKKNCFVTYHLQ